MSEHIFEELRSVEDSVENARRKLESLSEYIEALKKEILDGIAAKIEEARYTRFNREFLPAFLEEPYLIMPKRMEKGKAIEWYVIVPRFIDFCLGWLERSTKSYNVFIVNQYVKWFSEIPRELQERFRVKPIPGLKVADGLLLTPEDVQDEAWNRYKKHLSRREGKEAIRIKRGNEFQLIAQIIEDGSLPFIPRKVEPMDLRDPPETNIVLRDYQEDAWQKFLETGAVGIYWPFGVGKSFFGAYACAALKGRKLVVVPTITLKEQWNEYLRNHTRVPYEVQVETYHAFHKVKNNEYVLTIYDECNHLPANTFIRLATINTKYRMGFTGCVAKGTYVLCNDDWKKIEELDKPIVYSLKGGALCQSHATNFMTLWGNRQPYVVKSLSGKSLLCTSDHPILTLGGWKPAEELRKGDAVVTITEQPVEEKPLDVNFEEFLETYSSRQIAFVKAYFDALNLRSSGLTQKQIIERIKEKYGSSCNVSEWLSGRAKPVPLKEWEKVKPLLRRGNDLVRLFGFALGDGNLNEEYRLTYCVGAEEINPLLDAFEKLGVKCRASKKRGRDAFNVRPGLYALGRVFHLLGMAKGSRVREGIKLSRKIDEFKKEFLDGVFGAEGTPPYLRRRKFIHSYTTFLGGAVLALNTEKAENLKEFFNKLMEFLKGFGIDTSLRITKGWKRKDRTETVQFQLKVKSKLDNTLRFLHIINFAYSPSKQKRANEVLAYCILKKRKLLERMENIRNGKVPRTTLRAWRNGKRKFAELRNVKIDIPSFISENLRIEMVESSHKLERRFPIFDLRVEKTRNFIADGFVVHNSPYREDGRVNYIIALTGYPLGLAWEKFFELGIIKKPTVTLFVIPTFKDKMRKLKELMGKETGKTLIFCDSIDLGKRIAREYDLTFVFGETTRRLEKIRENERVVVSRVGDEGLDVPEIDTLIEVDFLFGSRWQQSQRGGRLLHSTKEATNHFILMTEEELEKYGKRLLALYERGFKINILR